MGTVPKHDYRKKLVVSYNRGIKNTIFYDDFNQT